MQLYESLFPIRIYLSNIPANNYVQYFDYDLLGNPTNFRGASPGLTSNSFDANNRIGNTGFTYDGAGNPTTYQSATFSFDPEDRLTSISSPAFSATYDGTGMRASKTEGGTTTYFLYDGDTPIAEETWNSGTSTATFSALNVFCADGWRVRYYPGSGVFYSFTFDPQGNVIQKQNSGNVLSYTYSTASFEAYGKRGADYTSSGGNPASHQDPPRFGGQYGYYTDNTGLLLLGHRYYDPGRAASSTATQSGITAASTCMGTREELSLEGVVPSTAQQDASHLQ